MNKNLLAGLVCLCFFKSYCLDVAGIADGFLNDSKAIRSQYCKESVIWKALDEDPKFLCEVQELKNVSDIKSAICYRLMALQIFNSFVNAQKDSVDSFEEDDPIENVIEALQIRLFEACKAFCEANCSSSIKGDSNALYLRLKMLSESKD